MKKTICLLLALLLCAAVGAAALADGPYMTEFMPYEGDSGDTGDVTPDEAQLRDALRAQDNAQLVEEINKSNESAAQDASAAQEALNDATQEPTEDNFAELPEAMRGMELPIITTEGEILTDEEVKAAANYDEDGVDDEADAEADEVDETPAPAPSRGSAVVWIVVIVVVVAAAGAAAFVVIKKKK